MDKRKLGRSGLDISALGVGCWTIGGLANVGSGQHGWVDTDDAESIRAVHRALDLGVTYFDTADVYGAGHSERLLGEALAGRDVVISTKFSKVYDEATRSRFDGTKVDADYIRTACEASLRRLRIEAIDLYFLHEGMVGFDKVDDIVATLEQLVEAGKVKWYGWSTDDHARALAFSRAPHCAAIQQRLNLLEGNRAILSLCEETGMASVDRSPLAQGLLTGKFSAATRFDDSDVRARWNMKDGQRADQLEALERVRALLTADGRSLAQGALGWLLATSSATVPIPGFKTVAQVEDNVGTLSCGPLSPETMRAIDDTLAAVAPER